jgi:hypothetical protein
MAIIEIEAKNIGGIEKMKANLAIGKVNLVKGSASSGKSSLMRGVHLGIVGHLPMEKKYEDEAKTLHLDDRISDQALLRRGASEGSVSIKTPSTSHSATIPRNGMIKGTNSNSRALFTTMLSALPPTRLYQAVFNSSTDAPNDFRWVVDELSEAGNYHTWHRVLDAVNQEAAGIRSKFQNWKKSLAGADERRSEIMKELSDISDRMTKRAGAKGADAEATAKKIAAATAKATTDEAEFRRIDGEYRQNLSANEHHQRRIDASQLKIKTATRVRNDAEELLDMDLVEPNTTKLDEAITAAQRKVEAADGDSNPTVKKIIDAYLKVKDSTPASLAKVIDWAQNELGDDSKLAAALEELKTAKSNRDKVVKSYLDNKRKFGMAEQQAAAARADITSAKATIKEAEKSMTTGGSSLPMQKEKRDRYESTYLAAKKELQRLQSTQSISDPQDLADQKDQLSLQDELSSLDNSTTFGIRFTSLNMLPNQTMELSADAAEKLLGSGSEGVAEIELIKSNLTKGEGEIRSLLIAEIDRNLLHHLNATSTWAAEEADRQRQETRRVFNEVGTTMFNRLKFSKITGVSLDVDYELKINWANQPKPTGLTGAGGERTIIATALLMAMRKAYTPEIPILMIDGVLENLDDRPREELLTFLGEYSKDEDIAIAVSVFDSSIAVAKVM